MARAVLLMGPTASAKSALAMEAASRLPLEIVSVDSAQVYAGMDIGTAKATAAERAAVSHHLLDIVPPTASYSAARFRDDALQLIEEIQARDRVPLLVGGTMLYFKALTGGLSSLPAADTGVRAAIEREAADVGWPVMHARLAELDPPTAARLNPRDSQRIQRALEVFRITGEPMSRLLGAPQGAADAAFAAVALVPGDRAALHRRIESRFERMLGDGLVEELAGLRGRYDLSADMPSMRTVGYRQAWQHLDGAFGVAELRNRGIHATRQLAKRQLTWLRSWQGSTCLDPFEQGASHALYDIIAAAAEA